MYAVTCYHTDVVQGSSQRLWQTQHFAAAGQAHNARHHLAALAEAALPLLSERHHVPCAEEKETQHVLVKCCLTGIMCRVQKRKRHSILSDRHHVPCAEETEAQHVLVKCVTIAQSGASCGRWPATWRYQMQVYLWFPGLTKLLQAPSAEAVGGVKVVHTLTALSCRGGSQVTQLRTDRQHNASCDMRQRHQAATRSALEGMLLTPSKSWIADTLHSKIAPHPPSTACVRAQCCTCAASVSLTCVLPEHVSPAISVTVVSFNPPPSIVSRLHTQQHTTMATAVLRPSTAQCRTTPAWCGRMAQASAM
jgi:hypothetical protein